MSVPATCRSVDKPVCLCVCAAGSGWVSFSLVRRFTDYSWAGGFGQLHGKPRVVTLALCIPQTNFYSRWKTGTTAFTNVLDHKETKNT